MTETRVLLPAVGAVLLDMDGTLLESEHASDRCWVAWCEKRGKDAAVVLPAGRGRRASATMRDFAPELSDDELAADIEAFSVAEAADTEGIHALTGSADLLAALRSARVPHALVTSAGGPLATARFAAAGLVRPDLAVHGDEVARSKPDPEGFLAAARELGIDPEACVVLEDSDAGVAAARAGGMRVVGIGDLARELDVDAWTRHPGGVRLVQEDGAVGLAVDAVR
ncbi:MAG: HAD-IA family hydrolase [Nocardioidaceae bacterium]|nr:HAD-IA family hydrolase [Nocardioidaceae bacterium]